MRVVSKALRNSAHGKSCTLRLPGCNHNPETVVLAHLPIPGRSIMGAKERDDFGIFCCSNCHDQLDSRIKGEKVDGWDALRALAETADIQTAEGLRSFKGWRNG
ncbi:putative nuclease YbcO [Halomonadaceae bacterium LMG 33818]|uniref:nuclease domain-containing protein n=1 Tax=Cernens ardua TaxID=3402176 RepID=UPI003EDB6EED